MSHGNYPRTHGQIKSVSSVSSVDKEYSAPDNKERCDDEGIMVKKKTED